jgi:hypothetical protein
MAPGELAVSPGWSAAIVLAPGLELASPGELEEPKSRWSFDAAGSVCLACCEEPNIDALDAFW